MKQRQRQQEDRSPSGITTSQHQQQLQPNHYSQHNNNNHPSPTHETLNNELPSVLLVLKKWIKRPKSLVLKPKRKNSFLHGETKQFKSYLFHRKDGNSSTSSFFSPLLHNRLTCYIIIVITVFCHEKISIRKKWLLPRNAKLKNIFMSESDFCMK